MSSLPERKRAELVHKLHALTKELELHRTLSEKPPFDKHRSQIFRVTATLGALHGEIEARIPAAGAVIQRAEAIEQRLLEVHRIWEFFRSKLAQRTVPWFAEYLVAADELAWAAYEPACQRAIRAGTVPASEVKEPPLVFLNGGWSPFTTPRGHVFAAEAVPEAPIMTPGLVRALGRLPIPVIGVPWYQLQHLPDALVIGHEVGHDVEKDLGLTRTIASLISVAVPPPRREAWLSWLGEVFADVYGVLVGGPAFAGALLDFLAAGKTVVREESRAGPEWGRYPTRYLRALLVTEALSKDFGPEAKARKDEWAGHYERHAMVAFEADVGAVVDRLLAGPYPEVGGARLDGILRFAPAMHDRAKSDADRLLRGGKPQSSDVRVLVAAARLAFEKDPSRYDATVQRRVLLRIQGSQSVGPRWIRPDHGARLEQRLAERLEADVLAGRRLFEELGGEGAAD